VGVSPEGLTAAQVFGGQTTTPPPATGGDTGNGGVANPPPATGAGQVLTWTAHGDTLAGGAGADTINASQGADKLTGGAGADTFAFQAMPWSAGKITDFQVGVDKLDVSALYAGGYNGANPIADGYVRFESDGQGGTKVMLDTDAAGTANPWSFHVVTLVGVSPEGLTAAQVFGGQTAPPPSPVVPGVVLTSTSYAETLTGGAGADTLTAWNGPDRLVGGGGDDHFVFDKLPWSAGRVADFTPGEDVIDLRPLFDQAGYQGTNPLADGYLKLESDGNGGTRVLVDTDGAGTANPWPFHITTLEGVSPSSLTASDWLFQ
ncbi:type I secretion C-terminal target domain-containing protein, partial [Phenylobacterium sp.]|uniref:type I secretion C-terminal target domain-containing protein n=1 Tax=Phenylobacterium sp. TaxID=1871053 RepID=UPI0035B0D03C